MSEEKEQNSSEKTILMDLYKANFDHIRHKENERLNLFKIVLSIFVVIVGSYNILKVNNTLILAFTIISMIILAYFCGCLSERNEEVINDYVKKISALLGNWG